MKSVWPAGNRVLDRGGGTTEAAVVAMNGIVAANCVRTTEAPMTYALMGAGKAPENDAIIRRSIGGM